MQNFRKFIAVTLPVALLVSLTSCEMFNKDELPDNDPTSENLDVQAILETPEVIDIAEGLNLTGSATITLVTPPASGTVELVGETYAVYTPGTLTQNHEDSFVLEITQGQRRWRRVYRMVIRSLALNGNSRGIAVYDRGGMVAPGAIDTTDVLANDLIPAGATVTRVDVLIPPRKGRATFNSSNILVYKADSLASGFDQMVYGVQLANGARGMALVKYLIQ